MYLYFIYSFERRSGGGNHSTEFSQGPQFLSLRKQKKSFSVRLENQNNYQSDGMKFLSKNMTSLSNGQFDTGFLYQLNPDNYSLKLLSSDLNPEKSLNDLGKGNLLSSFVLKSRVDNYEVNYISVCIPRTKALSLNGVSFQSLKVRMRFIAVLEINQNAV